MSVRALLSTLASSEVARPPPARDARVELTPRYEGGEAATVSISSQARRLAGASGGGGESEPSAPPRAASSSEEAQLSEDDEQQVRELEERDAEVRAHELAHKAAGGAHAGSISYTFQLGPDGKRYAVGGEVPIDVSPVRGDPEATQRKMDQVIRAALAPVNPSSADRQIAARAAAAAASARTEVRPS